MEKKCTISAFRCRLLLHEANDEEKQQMFID